MLNGYHCKLLIVKQLELMNNRLFITWFGGSLYIVYAFG